ncbi:hypothetical protein OPV22_001793 [Ensete ventricosum]|uniref:Uncharacterized protein n=1 Tax=Ensete ventricosum TaxID=4639 RepID=A0AAV8RWJ1_ENSVE|nr:hypothetical protein OPV22_001793 [Ensete ventricosum]
MHFAYSQMRLPPLFDAVEEADIARNQIYSEKYEAEDQDVPMQLKEQEGPTTGVGFKDGALDELQHGAHRHQSPPIVTLP